MKIRSYNNLSQSNRCLLVCIIFFMLVTASYAEEIYNPGTYVEYATGTKYVVAGAESHSGRTIWTIFSARNTDQYFAGIWETGPAIGNSILAGTSYIVSYPNGYGPGRSYGVIGSNNFSSWYEGGFLATIGNGNEIVVTSINSNGTTRDQFTITLIAEENSVLNSSEQFSSGIYRDLDGQGYLVSGSPSYNEKNSWSVTALPDNPYSFSGIWETGPAVNNMLLAGSSSISSYPYGYAAGRSYGIIGENNISGWNEGYKLTAVQTGNVIYLSEISTKGFTDDQMVLTNEAESSSAIDSSTESFLAGSNYEDFYGNTYTVSGSGSIWSITGTNGTSFNAQWQTGPAGTNTIVGGSSCISDYPYGYLTGRSYGATGENDFYGWREGGFLAVIQAEDTIYLSAINCNGSTNDQFLITKGGTGGTGDSGKGSFSTDYYYVNKFNGEAIIRINRTDGGDGIVSAVYSTSDGSAVAYTDYIPVSGGILSWGTGETNSKFITIDIPETASSGKTFSLHLTTPVGWELGSQKDATVEIFEDIGVDCLNTYEPNDSSIDAAVIASGTPQSHELCPVGDEDWATFTLTRLSSVVLETSGSSGDTRMWLYDNDLNEIEFDDDGGSNTFSKIELTCDDSSLPAGTYYVKIDEHGGDEKIDSYDFNFTAIACPCTGTDTDTDGVCDADDNCPDMTNPGQEDVDSDGVGDNCDNCPNASNPGQEDADNDGIGNVCENGSSFLPVLFLLLLSD
jgi:hypothetical protein